MPNVGNWTLERCSTVGTGNLILIGANLGFARWRDTVPAGSVWYTIEDGVNREIGIGSFNGVNTITRTTVLATLVGSAYDDSSPTPLDLSGLSTVSSVFTKSAFETFDGHVNTMSGNPHNVIPSEIPVATIGPTDIDNLYDVLKHMWSPGLLNGCVISDAGGGLVNITEGNIAFRVLNQEDADMVIANIAATTGLAITPGEQIYIYYDYNGGAPTLNTTNALSSINFETQIPLGGVYYDGTNIAIVSVYRYNTDGLAKIQARFLALGNPVVPGSSILGETGTRNITVTSGAIYIGVKKVVQDAFDTSALNTFTYWYQDGIGGWSSQTLQTQYSNTQYDNGSGTLQSVTANRFTQSWVYILSSDNIDSLHVVYGTSNATTLEAALAVPPPSTLPPVLTGILSRFVGRIVVEQGAATASQIDSATSTTFEFTTTTNHNALSNLQGGIVNEYYHMTATEHTDVIAHLSDTANPHSVTAAQTSYDNATSGLTATDVQGAIDELVTLPAGLQWSFQTLSFGTATNNGYLCDGGITVTLHAGSVGDVVALADTNGTFGASPLTVVGNVEGDAGGLVLDIDKAYVELVYDGTTWQIANFNANGLTPNAVTFLEAKAGRKNLLINGSMDIWQRGTGVVAGTSGGVFSADRWLCQAGNCTGNFSGIAFSAGTSANQNNATYYQQCDIVSASAINEFACLSQKIEGVQRLSDRTVTLSFWARASTVPLNLGLQVVQNFGTGGTPSSPVNDIADQVINISASGWNKYTVTVAIPSIVGKTLGTDGNDYTMFRFWFTAGTNYSALGYYTGYQTGTFDFTSLQIEEGTAETDFELRPIAEELSLCQRYYQQVDSTNALHSLGTGVCLSTTSCRIVAALPTKLRALFTLVTTGVATDYEVLTTTQHTCTAVPAINVNSTISPELTFITTGVTAGHGCVGRTRVTGAYLGFDAEL